MNSRITISHRYVRKEKPPAKYGLMVQTAAGFCFVEFIQSAIAHWCSRQHCAVVTIVQLLGQQYELTIYNQCISYSLMFVCFFGQVGN